MRFSPFRFVLLSTFFITTIVKGAVTYSGNGNTSAGGILGQGSLTLTDDLTNVTGTFTPGSATFTGDLVLYIDSVTNGFADTSTFGDGIGELQKAISGYNGSSSRSLLTFPAGFAADYAIALGPNSAGFGGLWKLNNGGFGSLVFSNDVSLATTNGTNYTFSFPLASIGLTPGTRGSFQLFGTYLSTSTGRSGEALPGNLSGTTGWNPFTVTAVTNYNVIPTYHVVNTNDNGVGSLRQAVAGAIPGSVIDFATNLSGQTITLTNGQLLIDKNLAIDATLLSSITLDGGNNSRIFEVTTNISLNLINLTLTRGNAAGTTSTTSGGALFADVTSTVNATGCTFTGNKASTGGAIYNLGQAMMNNCVFTNNSTTNSTGGAVVSTGGGGSSFALISSTFINNVANGNSGGAVWASGTALTATNCFFSGNHGANGGGLFVTNSTAMMTNCIFTNNFVTSSGGAIYNLSAVVVTGCLFTTNSAPASNGGAVYSGGSSLFTANASTFLNNRNGGSGGAICVDNTAVTAMNDCTFSGNFSSANAGALFLNTTTTNSIARCTFNGNTANNGAAMRIYGTVSMVNSTLTGNISTNTSTIMLSGGVSTFTNCTIVSNITVVATGGGIALNSGTLALENCIVADNVTAAQEIYKSGGILTHTGHNLIGRNTTITTEFPAGFPNPSGDFVGASTTPLASFLDPLGNNGGLTATMAPHLPSPAIDGGSITSGLVTDQRGFARPLGAAVDIGAVETTNNLNDYSWIITSTNDVIDLTDNTLTLREALGLAPNGQVITFDPGLAGQTMTVTNGQFIPNKNLTIDASSLSSLVLDANYSSRIFEVASNTTLTLKNLTLTRGNGVGKTGSGTGGALYNLGTTIVTNCIFANNLTTNSSGGAVVSTGTNSAFTATASTFANNRSGGNNGGGAIYADTVTIMTLTECTLNANSSQNSAGAIYLFGSAVGTINRCTFQGNYSYQGGAVRNSSGTLVVLDSTFNGNIASNSAGAMYLSGGLSYFTNCTIAGNSCPTNLGGGIQVSGGTTALENCIVADNSAVTNPDIYKTGGTIVHTGHNLIGRNASATSDFPTGLPNSSGDLVGTNTAPLSANLQPLGNYGGLTLTMPPQTNSLAIEGGSATTSLAVDQRGFPRLNGAYVDIGAVESTGGITNTNWTVTATNDAIDGLVNNGLSLREAMVYAPAGTRITFDPGLSGQTIAVTNGPLPATKTLTIDASGLASLILDGLNATRLIEVPTNSNLTLNGLTLVRGNGVGTTANGNGGAIYDQGVLLVTNCVFSNNFVATGAGAIYLTATANATATGCSFSSNSAASGGALYNNTGLALVTNCVFSNNFTTGGGAAAYSTGSNSFFTAVASTFVNNTSIGNSYGGAIYGNTATTVALTNCLFNGNAAAGGGAVCNNADTLVVNACLFTNNAATNVSGGAIFAGGGTNSIAVTGSTFVNNYAAAASDGGGIYCASTTTLSASNCAFSGNHSFFAGGGIQVTVASKAALTNCTFAGNYSGFAGGIYNQGAVTTVNCLFTNNFATNSSAGAINTSVNSAFTAIACTFANNRTGPGNNGGALFVDNGAVAFETDCTFSGNSATVNGGAMYLNSTSTNTTTRCTFNGNMAANGGAARSLGIFTAVNSTFTGNISTNSNSGSATTISSGAVAFTNCTVDGNTCISNGGAFNMSGGALTLENCIVADTFSASQDMYVTSGTVTSTGHNLIGKNSSVTTVFPTGSPNASGDYAGTLAAPVSPVLAPLSNYGGLTATLLPILGSPAIDGGSATSILAVDQRGSPRLVGGAVDLGAVESSIILSNFNWVVTSTNDNLRGIDSNSITLRQALIAAPAGTTITFSTNLSGQTITLTNELLLNKSVTLAATSLANGITISAYTNRLILVTNPSVSVSLINLTLVNGNGASAIMLNGQGAAILNLGTMALTGCTLATNNAGFGAIRQQGTMTMTNCTLANNYSTNEGGGYFGAAGSIVTMIHCTISSNNATTTGGGIRIASGTAIVSNSIIAGNAQGGSLSAINANVTGPLGGTNNLITITPLLYPLGNYGGPTLTMPPQPGSAAIDACTNGTTLTTDQRGYARVVGTYADIGSVETGNTLSNVSWVVTSTNDNIDGFNDMTLREAFAFAPTGQPITFSPTLAGQTILLTNGEFIVTHNTVIDATGLSAMTLDGGNVTRIFEVTNGVALGLSKLTLTRGNGNGQTGSGSGGAVYNLGAVSVTNCIFNANTSTNSNGGAIFSTGAGGAITAVASTFTGNSVLGVSSAGGAIYATTLSTLNATDCTFSGNYSTNTGGALYLLGGFSGTLTRCTFNGNVAIAGAGFRMDSGSLTVVNSTFNGNSATNSGSAVYQIGGVSSYANCTIDGNSCRNTGGGIGLAGGTLALENCIVADNSGGTLLDIYKTGGTLTHTGHNLIGKNSSVTTEFPVGSPNGSGDYVGQTGALISASLAALSTNGGLTATMLPQSGSLAIDGGSTTSSLLTDQRGVQRKYGAAVDIGAIEVIYPSSASSLAVQFATNGMTQFSFTNYSGLTQTIITSTNIATPLTNWTVLGPAVESPSGSGKFSFSEPATTNRSVFYQVRTP